MSTLKPLLLPQLVEDRRKMDAQVSVSVAEYPLGALASASVEELPVDFVTANSSSSDVASPMTPTFYSRGHVRGSSSSSSLDPAHIKRQLPDVMEEPLDIDVADSDSIVEDQFGLYNCLCDNSCDHRDTLAHPVFRPFEFDDDKPLDSPFVAFTTRMGSRLTMNRWRTSRKPSLVASPTTEVSFETATRDILSAPASRSSSMSAPRHIHDTPTLTIPDFDRPMTPETADIERDRELATTPLLPPFLNSPLLTRRAESPLQSPTVATFTDPFPRPSLSSQPSISSFRRGPSGSVDLPLPLQEHDEWSDRLGHANFTITPRPYEIDEPSSESLAKFMEDLEAARVNYTKHLVRTGENYGHTSNIYALTEAKWAETERTWQSYHDAAVARIPLSQPMTPSTSRGRSRGRARGRSRSGSASAVFLGRPNDDAFAGSEWRKLEGPSAVPRMLEALDADGKFPERGDVDIVGPMQRDEVMMSREGSEERKGSRLWKSLVGKVGLAK